MDSNLNQLAPITDFDKAYILAQQALEMGFRGTTFPEMYIWLKGKLDLTGLSNTAGLPENFPEPGSTLEATTAQEWTVLGPGNYNKIVSGTITIEEDEFAFGQFDGIDFNRVLKVKMPSQDISGLTQKGGFEGTAKELKDDIEEVKNNYFPVEDEYLHLFSDKNNAVYGFSNRNGEFDIKLTENAKNEIQNVKTLNENHVFSIEGEGREAALYISDTELYLRGSKDVQYSANIDPSKIYLSNISKIKSRLVLNSIAVGRASAIGVDDAVKIPLTDSGYTHPKMLYIPQGWNGYKYWLAITPTFGIIAEQVGPAYFENPHIFASNDAINWIEPTQNPIDVPAPFSFTNVVYPFNSDTHLLIGDDGWMYCYYRMTDMPREYVNNNPGEAGVYKIAMVCKKSRDGVNWSERMVVFGDDTPGVNADNLPKSQAYFYKGAKVQCYDMVKTSALLPIPPQKNQTEMFIFRRSSFNPAENNEPYTIDKIIDLENRPWGETKDPWHIDGEYVDGIYYLLIAVGLIDNPMSNDLYLATSGDGWKFKVHPAPIYQGNTYRSSLTPVKIHEDGIDFLVIRADTSDGHQDLLKVEVKYKKD